MDTDDEKDNLPSNLVIEAFYGGSHKQLIDLIISECGNNSALFTLPAKKWHWRARTAALYFAEIIPKLHNFKTLFTSSVLNLAELIALRPDLSKLKKIIYFHENQLNYPVQEKKDRDFHYGYSQILSCMVADKIVFNSNYNHLSFINGIKGHLKMIPDHRPSREFIESILLKCSVQYFPLEMNDIDCSKSLENKNGPLHIVWPHRWEHDKQPDVFFKMLYQLCDEEIPFKVSILGEKFQEVPSEFDEAKKKLGSRIEKWGYLESKDEYFKLLTEADVVISTAAHEFFGVAMLEAVNCGCYPICPNRLVYPEIFPKKYLYNTDNQLFKITKNFCKHPTLVRQHKFEKDLKIFSWKEMKSKYMELMNEY